LILDLDVDFLGGLRAVLVAENECADVQDLARLVKRLIGLRQNANGCAELQVVFGSLLVFPRWAWTASCRS
jgi:hypothetical protein